MRKACLRLICRFFLLSLLGLGLSSSAWSQSHACSEALLLAQAVRDGFPAFIDGTPEQWQRLDRIFQTSLHLLPNADKLYTAGYEYKKPWYRNETDSHWQQLIQWGFDPSREHPLAPEKLASIKLRRFFLGFYLQMYQAYKEGKIQKENLAFPSVKLMPARNKWLRVGIDPWKDFDTHTIAEPGLIPFRSWAELRKRGIIPLDFISIDHDLAHLSVYARNPVYFNLLQAWYRGIQSKQHGDRETIKRHNTSLSGMAHFLDEAGIRIDSPQQVETFKDLLPVQLTWNSSEADVSALRIEDKLAWSERLLNQEHQIYSPHGAVPTQFYPGTNISHLINFVPEFKKLALAIYKARAQADPSAEKKLLSEFILAGFVPTLFRYLETLSSPAQMQFALMNLDTEKHPQMKEVVSSLREQMLDEVLKRIFFGYRVFVERELSPERLIMDQNSSGTGFEPGSPSEDYARALKFNPLH